MKIRKCRKCGTLLTQETKECPICIERELNRIAIKKIIKKENREKIVERKIRLSKVKYIEGFNRQEILNLQPKMLAKFIKQKLTIQYIAEKCGVSNETIRKRLIEYNIK